MASGRLSIGAFEITAVAPRNQRPLPWLAGDLTELATRLVAPRLAAALGAELPDDGSVWTIRELTIDLAVATRWSADEIADRIAAAILAAIRRVLRGPADSGVVRLADRADHLACVLRDIAAGGGPSWRHGAWAGAVDRPRAEALATVLREAGEDAAVALTRLGGATAAQVVALLPPQAAASLARAWGAHGPLVGAQAEPAAVAAVRDALRRLPGGWRAEPPRAALLLLALAGEASPQTDMLALAAAVRSVLFGTPATVGADPPPPRAALPPPDAEAADAGDIEAAQPGSRPAGNVRSTPQTAHLATITTHAGLFMLWRSAIQSEALAHAVRLGGDAGAAALVRALTGDADDPLLDPAVRLLLRLTDEEPEPPPMPSLPALLDAMASDGWRKPAVTHAALEIAEFAPGRRAAILADADSMTWLWLWPDGPPPAEALLARLGPGVALLVDAGLAEELQAPWPREPTSEGQVWLRPPDAQATQPPPWRPGRLVRDLAALRHPADAPETLPWACLAQRVFRDLARRLPGFAPASPDWLRANILPRTASVSLTANPDGEVLTVTVHPPPLAMISRIAGLLPGGYRLPGEPRRTVDLQLARR